MIGYGNAPGEEIERRYQHVKAVDRAWEMGTSAAEMSMPLHKINADTFRDIYPTNDEQEAYINAYEHYQGQRFVVI